MIRMFVRTTYKSLQIIWMFIQITFISLQAIWILCQVVRSIVPITGTIDKMIKMF